MIELEALDFRYPHGDFRLRIEALSVEPASTVAVIGPSGSGKTTLLNLVAGIAVPRSGRVRVDGTEISALGDAARRRIRIDRIGLVFQEFELLEYLNVLENILLPVRISGGLGPARGLRERAVALAGEVGLASKIRRGVTRLSQGERQRVAICRALVTEPKLLLADEPTGNLDPANKGHVLDILLRYARRTAAPLLIVTHDHNLLDRFDRVVDFEAFDVSYGSPGSEGGNGANRRGEDDP